jgi:acyl-[acyl-carrier-protein]-phospholipid O-acyltransferase/long-chain-fatty-acid--[acyl-carrier-protein] ligase
VSDRGQRLPRTFWWANLTQFGGALNDNLFKLFITFALIAWADEGARAGVVVNVSLAFTIPFLLFVPIAGSFADHYSKRWIIVTLKGAEVGVMSFGVYGLASGNSAFLYVTMVLMSTQSAFFGPCKYGIIPELVGSQRLSRANGMIQMFTYLAILTGTIAAPSLSEIFGDFYWKAGLICIVVAGAGFVFSLGIGPSPSHLRRPINLNGFVNLLRTRKVIQRDGFLALAVLATSFFTLIGAYMQINLFEYGPEHLGLTSEQSARLFLITAVGIGIGSVMAGWLSGRVIEFGIVPIGTALMWICLVVIGTVPAGSLLAVRICMFLIGIGAGFYVVPLESFIQYRSPGDKVGSVKAASSFLSWIGVLIATGLMHLFATVMNLTAQTGFLLISFLLLGLSVFSFWVLPDFFVKFVVMYLVRGWYRLRVYGIENLPTDRPALLVCNHVSLIDAILVVSSQQRRIRTLMSRNVYDRANWFIRKTVDLAGVILIQDTDGPKKLVASLKKAREALDEGFLVCIFAEGGLTLSGMMRPFKPGFERIIKGSEHPIIPVYIGGAWGSSTSWKKGMPRVNLFKDLRHRVSVHFGKAIPSTSTVAQVQRAVRETGAESFELMKADRLSLGESFVRIARDRWDQTALIDEEGRPRTYGQLLSMAYDLRHDLLRYLPESEQRVGVILPSGVENVVLNVALALERLVPVPMNPREPAEEHHGRMEQTSVRTLITSSQMMEGRPVSEFPGNLILLDDILPEAEQAPTLWKRFWMRNCPTGKLSRVEGFHADEIASILFTRGTVGSAKPVCLSHHNILSNLESLSEVIRPKEEDTLLGVLPHWNSFGYVTNLWFPLLGGATLIQCGETADPTHAAQAAGRFRASILVASPGFLASCVRNVDPEAFSGMRYVFTGGESLPEETSEAFEKKFGLAPLESYGSTELSAVCCISLPDVRISRFRETGRKARMSGRPLPGIAIKILDPETGQGMPAGEEGMIAVKGSNVMLGYAGEEPPEKGLAEGWFLTGDRGYMDENGFLSVTGRC